MKKLLLKLTLLFIPFFLLGAWVELNIRSMDNSYSFKKRAIESNLDSLQILILGSSHGNRDIDPSYLSLDAINMANVSQSLYYDKRIYYQYKKLLPNLRYVIIPISYFSLNYSLDDSAEHWRVNFYEHVWGWKPEKKSNLWDSRRYSYYLLYGSKKSTQFVLHKFKDDLVKGYKSDGALLEYFPVKDLSYRAALKRIRLHNKEMNNDNFVCNINYLKAIIKDAKSRNVRVILITLPVHPRYYQFMDKARYSQMQNAIRQLQNEYAVPYYNWIQDATLSNSDFNDIDHLNPKGAQVISKRLNSYLK